MTPIRVSRQSWRGCSVASPPGRRCPRGVDPALSRSPPPGRAAVAAAQLRAPAGRARRPWLGGGRHPSRSAARLEAAGGAGLGGRSVPVAGLAPGVPVPGLDLGRRRESGARGSGTRGRGRPLLVPSESLGSAGGHAEPAPRLRGAPSGGDAEPARSRGAGRGRGGGARRRDPGRRGRAACRGPGRDPRAAHGGGFPAGTSGRSRPAGGRARPPRLPDVAALDAPRGSRPAERLRDDDRSRRRRRGAVVSPQPRTPHAGPDPRPHPGRPAGTGAAGRTPRPPSAGGLGRDDRPVRAGRGPAAVRRQARPPRPTPLAGAAGGRACPSRNGSPRAGTIRRRRGAAAGASRPGTLIVRRPDDGAGWSAFTADFSAQVDPQDHRDCTAFTFATGGLRWITEGEGQHVATARAHNVALPDGREPGVGAGRAREALRLGDATVYRVETTVHGPDYRHVRTFVLLEDLSGIAVFDRFATRERPLAVEGFLHLDPAATVALDASRRVFGLCGGRRLHILPCTLVGRFDDLALSRDGLAPRSGHGAHGGPVLRYGLSGTGIVEGGLLIAASAGQRRSAHGGGRGAGVPANAHAVSRVRGSNLLRRVDRAVRHRGTIAARSNGARLRVAGGRAAASPAPSRWSCPVAGAIPGREPSRSPAAPGRPLHGALAAAPEGGRSTKIRRDRGPGAQPVTAARNRYGRSPRAGPREPSGARTALPRARPGLARRARRTAIQVGRAALAEAPAGCPRRRQAP